MHVRLVGPAAERWALWFSREGHETTILSTAVEAASGQLVVVTGGDVSACAAATAVGAEVIAVDVSDEMAEALVLAGARGLWRADASPAWLRAELRLLARDFEHVVAVARTAREHHESTLRVHALLSSSATIIASMDRESIFTFVAGDPLATLGLKPEMLVGQRALELFAGRAP